MFMSVFVSGLCFVSFYISSPVSFLITVRLAQSTCLACLEKLGHTQGLTDCSHTLTYFAVVIVTSDVQFSRTQTNYFTHAHFIALRLLFHSSGDFSVVSIKY